MKNKNIIFGVIAFMIIFLFMEISSYGIFKISELSKYEAGEVDNPYHPFLGWEHRSNAHINTTKPCSPRNAFIETDQNGFSITPYLNFEDPVLRIAVTGGSTIFGVGSSNNDSTIPSYLEKIIWKNFQHNTKVEVYNLAVRGYNSFQEMLSLYRFLKIQNIDLVLTISGRNDSSQVLEQRGFPEGRYKSKGTKLLRKAEKGELIFLEGIVHRLRSHSYAVDLFYNSVGWLFLREATRKGINAPDFENLFQRVLLTKSHYALINTMSQENNAVFAMFLQPTAYTKDVLLEKEVECINQQNDYDSERVKYHKKYEQMFYDNFRLVDKSFTFYDITNVFDNMTSDVMYVDNCHYNDKGALLIAQTVFERIEPTIKKILHKKKQ